MGVNMGYCRHENTYKALREVEEEWFDYEEGSNEYEDRARKGLIQLINHLYWQFRADGAYPEDEED